jgi:hypothetical protein
MTTSAIKCTMCAKFCRPADSQRHFGCSDPTDPEPYDPEFYCGFCAMKLKREWEWGFQNGHRYGCWEKSKAEIEAAKEAGLVWVGNLPTLRDDNGHTVMNRYVTQEEAVNWLNNKLAHMSIADHEKLFGLQSTP